jgi:hypothetical protein
MLLDCASAVPDPTNAHSTAPAAKRRVIALYMAKAPLPLNLQLPTKVKTRDATSRRSFAAKRSPTRLRQVFSLRAHDQKAGV